MKSFLLILSFWLPLSVSLAQNGFVDSSFGVNGIAATKFYGQTDIATCTLIQKDNKILTAGYTLSLSSYQFAVVRHLPDGTLDSTFGTDGKTIIAFSTGNAFCTSMTLQPDGKIILAGYTTSPISVYDFALARIMPDGKPDSSFGVAGKTIRDFNNGDDRIQSVTLVPPNKILTAGSTVSTSGVTTFFALAMFHSDGRLDSTFGTNGFTTSNLGAQNISGGTAVALQNGEKIIVGGYSYNSQWEKDFAIARYNLNGSLDTTFGKSGKLLIDFGLTENASSLVVEPDGKIIMAGNAESNSGGITNVLLAKLDLNGTPDPTFGSNGKVSFNTGYQTTINGMALRKNGNFNLTGFVVRNEQLDIILLQFTNNGAVDTLFGTKGKTITDWGGAYDKSNAIAIQPDGKIVIAGVKYYPAIFYTSRYNNEDVFEEVYWTGAIDNNWHNPGNWNKGVIPGGYTDVIINIPNLCTIQNAAVCRTLRVSTNARVTVKNKLTVYQ